MANDRLNPAEFNIAQATSNPLQLEVTNARHATAGSDTTNHDSAFARFSKDYQDILNKVPTPVVGAVGLAAGLAASSGGIVGLAGKGIALGLGVGFGVDAGLRLFGHSSDGNNSSAFLRDGLVLGGLVGGNLLGRGLRSWTGAAAESGVLNTSESYTGRLTANSLSPVTLETSGARTTAQIIPFPRTLETSAGRTAMITEADIAKFPAEQHGAIRAEIEAMSKRGYDPRFLKLGNKGEVIYDSAAEEASLDLDFFKPKKP